MPEILKSQDPIIPRCSPPPLRCSAVRTAAAAWSWSPRRFTASEGDSEIARRHHRLPLLRLSGHRRHPRDASQRARARRRKIRSKPGVRTWPAGRCSISRASTWRASRPSPPRPSATYREALAALGPAYESGYFLYRFSDPGLCRRAPADSGDRPDGRRRRPRDRSVRRLGSPHALADGPDPAAAGARRSLLRQALAGAAIHGARLRSDLLRRQFPVSVRPRCLPLCDLRRRVHVHLDQAAVRPGDAAGRRRRPQRRSGGHHATPTTSCSGARRLVNHCPRAAISICSKRCQPVCSARWSCSPT